MTSSGTYTTFVKGGKIDLKPRRYHGYAVALFIFGTLFPPLAVAARFGIGSDFWLNLLLTICGYIPGHVHNFYIQNIRNNKNNARTPKWVQKYGLVDTSDIKRKERRSQWAARYNDRLPHSALEGQPYEEGQEQGSSVSLSSEGDGSRTRRKPNGELWGPEDEQYYNAPDSNAASSGRWHYPANFEDAVVPSTSKKSKKKDKKDRWERTQDAYSISEETGGKRKKSKKKKSRSSLALDETTSRDDSVNEFPEDAEGRLYGDSTPSRPRENRDSPAATTDDVFNHQF